MIRWSLVGRSVDCGGHLLLAVGRGRFMSHPRLAYGWTEAEVFAEFDTGTRNAPGNRLTQGPHLPERRRSRGNYVTCPSASNLKQNMDPR